MFSFGVDIGGMSIKTGLVDEAGKIVSVRRTKTSKDASEDINNIVKDIESIILETKINRSEVKGVGIGCPGAVSSNSGIVDILPNLGWEKVPVVEMLKKATGFDVKISNDANVAALAETVYGSARGYNNVIMFTLGTGVGGGIIIDKKLYEGNDGKGAELGHSTLFLDGKECTCGRRGCIECYVSATALMEQTKEEMLKNKDSYMWSLCEGDINNVSGKTAFDGEAKGDASAKKVVDTYVKYLGESMMNMFNIFRPEAFILGGGVSAQGENLTKRLEEYCEKQNYGYKLSPKVKILTAKLGNDAGIIGAGALFN